MLTRYKVHVAPLYGSELERHLFATASFRDRPSQRAQRDSVRRWLQKRWEERAARWKDQNEESQTERGQTEERR